MVAKQQSPLPKWDTLRMVSQKATRIPAKEPCNQLPMATLKVEMRIAQPDLQELSEVFRSRSRWRSLSKRWND